MKPQSPTCVFEELEPLLMLSAYDPTLDSNLGFNVIGFYEQGPEGAEDWSEAIHEMYALGASDVTLVLYRVLDASTGSFLENSGPKLTHIESALVRAKQLGMEVTLSAIFETDGWRGEWDPSGALRQNFYASYRELIFDLAEIGTEHSADRLTFASELEQFMRNAEHASFLDSLISDLDEVFDGGIGYAATALNFDHPTLKSMVWEHPQIDYVAVNAYYSNYFADNTLADASHTIPEEELLSHFEQKWNDLFDNQYLPYVQTLRNGTGMPFYIQEFGAVPLNRTTVANWSISPGTYTGADSESPDAEEQRLLYESLIRATKDRADEISNVFFWTWAFGGNESDLFGINPNRPLASDLTGMLVAEKLASTTYTVNVVGDTATITGTVRDDNFTWRAIENKRNAVGLEVHINGHTLPLPSNVARINFLGNGGHDSVNLFAGDSENNVIVMPATTVVNGPTIRIRATGFNDVFVDGGKGENLVTISGTEGDETLDAKPNSIRLVGETINFHADNFARANVYGLGGNDTAVFYDSPKHDRFTSHSERTTMRDTAFRFVNTAYGFATVSAFADAGGKDYAFLYDRPSDDQLVSGVQQTHIESLDGDFITQVNGFEQVHAFSTEGGHDVATLTELEGPNDLLIVRSDDVRFQAKNKSFLRVARGFEDVTAYGTSSDRDRAFIYDSPGDDLFVAKPFDVSFFPSNGATIRIVDFQRTTADATAGGHDRAIAYDSSGDDRFIAKAKYVTMRAKKNHYINKMIGFDTYQAFATSGGFDASYLYGRRGVDLVTMDRQATRMSDPSETYSFEAHQFDRCYVQGGSLQEDIAHVFAHSPSDVIDSKRNRIELKTLDGEFYGRISGFEFANPLLGLSDQ